MRARLDHTVPVIELFESPASLSREEIPHLGIQDRRRLDALHQAIVDLLSRSVFRDCEASLVVECDVFVGPVWQVVVLELRQIGEVHTHELLCLGVSLAEDVPIVVILIFHHKSKSEHQQRRSGLLSTALVCGLNN